ncbi:hypothetical protein LguiA_020839 [Lonicera macranthoides]
MIEDGCADTCIPIPNVTGKVLAMVIEYCKKHVKDMTSDEKELTKFDAEFVSVDQDTLYNLILAANYLNIKSLLDLTTQKVVDTIKIKGKTPAEIRMRFNIMNVFTPEKRRRPAGSVLGLSQSRSTFNILKHPIQSHYSQLCSCSPFS